MTTTTAPSTIAEPPARGIRLDHVYLAVALILLALRPLLTPIPPHDFWWHLAMGRDIMSTGGIPTVDQYSFTRSGEPFYDQSWLSQLLMYGGYQLGGVELLIVLQAFVIMLSYGMLLWLSWRRSGRLRLSVVILLLTTFPLSFDNWNIRPQSYVLPIFVGFLVILTAYRLGWFHRLWLLPILMAVWVNIHGTFILGLGMIGMTFVGIWLSRKPDEQPSPPLRPLFFWGCLSGLAILLNPRGFGVISYVRNLVGSNAVTSLVTEWAAPTIRETSGIIFFLFVMICVVALVYARTKPSLTDMLLLGVFFWLALSAGRSIIWFGIIATPILIDAIASRRAAPRQSSAGSPVINMLLIGLLGLLLIPSLPWLKPMLIPPPTGSLLSSDTPVAATKALLALPQRPQRLFHAMSFGSYLIWAAPEQKVFADPRIELYPFAQWRDYINLGQGNNVQELLTKYQIDGLLLSKQEQKGLLDWASQNPAWVIQYEDEQTILFLPAS